MVQLKARSVLVGAGGMVAGCCSCARFVARSLCGKHDGLSEAARSHACLLNKSLQTVNKNVPYFNLKSLYIAGGVWPRRFGREVWISLRQVPG